MIFLIKHWKWILLAAIIAAVYVYYKNKKVSTRKVGATVNLDTISRDAGRSTEEQTAKTAQDILNNTSDDINDIKSKGNAAGIQFLTSNETHTMEYNSKRVIIEFKQKACVMAPCPQFEILSIG